MKKEYNDDELPRLYRFGWQSVSKPNSKHTGLIVPECRLSVSGMSFTRKGRGRSLHSVGLFGQRGAPSKPPGMDLLHPSPQHHGLPWHSTALFLYFPSPDSLSAHKYSISWFADPFPSVGCIKTSATHDYNTLNLDTRPGYHTHWHLHCYIRLSKCKLKLFGEWITRPPFLNASIPVKIGHLPLGHLGLVFLCASDTKVFHAY